jgi:hypothetical protein
VLIAADAGVGVFGGVVVVKSHIGIAVGGHEGTIHILLPGDPA